MADHLDYFQGASLYHLGNSHLVSAADHLDYFQGASRYHLALDLQVDLDSLLYLCKFHTPSLHHQAAHKSAHWSSSANSNNSF